VLANVANISAGNVGSATVTNTYDDTGFSLDAFNAAGVATAVGASGVTHYTNLAPSSELDITNSNGTPNNAHVGTITTTQTAAAGSNSLNVVLTGGNGIIVDSLNVSGDNALTISNPGTGGNTISSLVDGGATNTLATLNVVATNSSLTIASITDTALTKVDSHLSTSNVVIGNGAAVTNDGVTFSLAAGASSTVTATGVGDVFTMATGGGLGVVNLTASGAGDVFTLTSTNGGNVITANGAGDTFNIGNAYTDAAGAGGGYTITATGNGDTVVFSPMHNTASTVTVGSGATVTLGKGNETIVVKGDVTGGTTSGAFSETVINHATAGSNEWINFTDGTLTGGQYWMGQVNVATATTLAQALDLAANYSALTQVQGAAPAVSAGLLPANASSIDWFQFGGDTYIVEAVNNTGAAAAQTALDANDIVVKVVGLVDLSGHAGATVII
jgi:hypothetical protein